MIRKLYALAFFATLLGLTLSPSKLHAQNTSNFTISSFQGDYYLSKDDTNVSHMRIVERIDALFPNYDQNHGIERALPKSYKNRNVNLKIESVTNESGIKLNYTTRESNNNEVLRIGNANQYVHGSQTYVLTYSLDYPISFYDNHDELYWNTNGTEWQQPFNNATAHLHIGPTIPDSAILPQMTCFTGIAGAKNNDCTITQSHDDSGTIITSQTTGPLAPAENLTFVIGFTSGTFAKPPTDWKAVIGRIILLAGIVLPPLTALIVMTWKWLTSGRDAKGRGVIVAQYQPQKGISPLVGDLLLHEKMRPVAISASIINLCISKYLNMYETTTKKMFGSKTQYEIAIMKDTSSLSKEEKKVLTMLFSDNLSVGERVNVSEMKNKLYKDIPALTSLVEQIGVTDGYFIQSPDKIRKKYASVGSALIVLGLICCFIRPLSFLGSLIVAGIIVVLFGRIMPARSIKGVEARDYLLGMKDYMKLAEADRIQTLQSPHGAEKLGIDPHDPAQLVKLYEKLLPYAILFGIEKQWIKQFADLYKTPPDWYHGSHAFNSAVFLSSMSSLNTATMNSFSAPSSSSSSGFGGGGFSGGGGGGGGGGGW